jgi:SAM-dependent methyltransferase
MTCRVCGSPDLSPLWADGDGYRWSRCGRCGSDTSAAAYQPGRYGPENVGSLMSGDGNNLATALANHEHNAVFFDRHAPGLAGRTFLDVGCGAGVTIEVMHRRGWVCCGWDVTVADRPPGTVVSPAFRAELFARPFDAVMAREVLEHTPDPHGLLRELYLATAEGGVCQVTTPRPLPREHCRDGRPEWLCYHWAHLAVWHPDALRAELGRVGFTILETDLWELGQRHICRRPSG